MGSSPFPFFDKSLDFPLPRPPTAHEDDAADVLVEGEAHPHAYESEAERDTDDITQAYGDAPLEDNAHHEGVDRITGGAQGAASENIGRTSHLKEDVDHEHPYSHCNDFSIVGEGTKDAPSCQGQQD